MNPIIPNVVKMISERFVDPDEEIEFLNQEIDDVSTEDEPIEEDTLNKLAFDLFRETMRNPNGNTQKFVYVDIRKLFRPDTINDAEWTVITSLKGTDTRLIGPLFYHTGDHKDADSTGHFTLVVIDIDKEYVDEYDSLRNKKLTDEIYALVKKFKEKVVGSDFRWRTRSAPSQRRDKRKANTCGLHVYANMKDVLGGQRVPLQRDIGLIRDEIMKRMDELRAAVPVNNIANNIGHIALNGQSSSFSSSSSSDSSISLNIAPPPKKDIISDSDPLHLGYFTSCEIADIRRDGSPIPPSTLNKMTYNLFKSCINKDSFIYVDIRIFSSSTRNWSSTVLDKLGHPKGIKRFVGPIHSNGHYSLVEMDVDRSVLKVYGDVGDKDMKKQLDKLHTFFDSKNTGNVIQEMVLGPSQRHHPPETTGLNVYANLRDVVEGTELPSRRSMEAVRVEVLRDIERLRNNTPVDMGIIPKNTKCTLQEPYKIRSTQDVFLSPDHDKPQFCHTTILISGVVGDAREKAEIKRAYKETPTLYNRDGTVVGVGKKYSIQCFVGKHVFILKRIGPAYHFSAPNVCEVELIDAIGNRDLRQLGFIYTPFTNGNYYKKCYKQELSFHFVFHQPNQMNQINLEKVEFGRNPLPKTTKVDFLEGVYIGNDYLEVMNRVMLPICDIDNGYMGQGEYLNLTHTREFLSDQCADDGSLTVQNSATDIQDEDPKSPGGKRLPSLN